MKHHNRDIMATLCKELKTPNLSDCAFVRLDFKRVDKQKKPLSTRKVTMFICHGTGGGSSVGAEPNKLFRLASDKNVDIVLTGHTHTMCVLPPIVVLEIPARGELPKEPIVHEKYAANWGSFLRSYVDGPSTYVSRGLYPARALYTVVVTITPHRQSEAFADADITIEQLKLV
jgi:hypothetical protein